MRAQKYSAANSTLSQFLLNTLMICKESARVNLKLLLCSLFAVCSLTANAQWVSLSASSEAEYFYGEELQRDGDHISLWRLSNFIKPLTNLEGKEVLSEKTRATLDCKNGKLANSEVTRFADLIAQGEVMNHYETPLRFTRIAPDSVDALLMQKLCSK